MVARISAARAAGSNVRLSEAAIPSSRFAQPIVSQALPGYWVDSLGGSAKPIQLLDSTDRDRADFAGASIGLDLS